MTTRERYENLDDTDLQILATALGKSAVYQTANGAPAWSAGEYASKAATAAGMFLERMGHSDESYS